MWMKGWLHPEVSQEEARSLNESIFRPLCADLRFSVTSGIWNRKGRWGIHAIYRKSIHFSCKGNLGHISWATVFVKTETWWGVCVCIAISQAAPESLLQGGPATPCSPPISLNHWGPLSKGLSRIPLLCEPRLEKMLKLMAKVFSPGVCRACVYPVCYPHNKKARPGDARSQFWLWLYGCVPAAVVIKISFKTTISSVARAVLASDL